MIAAIRALEVPIRAGAVACLGGCGAAVDWRERTEGTGWIGLNRSDASPAAATFEAFKRLFEAFRASHQGLMLKAGCSSDEAEEIAQSTMIAVWRKAHQFDPATAGAPASIFTDRIATCGSICSAAGRGQSGFKPISELPDAPAGSSRDGRCADVARAGCGADRRGVIKQLSAEQSTVVKLSFIEERPHPEIASALGIPLGTVRSRIEVAMNRLRDILDEEA